MKYVVNIDSREPDEDPTYPRSLRDRVKDRDSEILRDTYYLIDPEECESRGLKMGHTTIYPTGSTTGHSHDDMEETYFFISGKGTMVVGDDEFDVEAGDALYVPPGEYHTTYQRGNLPLRMIWVTGKIKE
ncbi:MAG: cupin domain-containing protein [Halanaerobium sp.]